MELKYNSAVSWLYGSYTISSKDISYMAVCIGLNPLKIDHSQPLKEEIIFNHYISKYGLNTSISYVDTISFINCIYFVLRGLEDKIPSCKEDICLLKTYFDNPCTGVNDIRGKLESAIDNVVASLLATSNDRVIIKACRLLKYSFIPLIKPDIIEHPDKYIEMFTFFYNELSNIRGGL